MARLALFAIVACLLLAAPAQADAHPDGAPPEVLLSADVSMTGLIDLYHAVVSEHDVNDVIIVHPPEMEGLYGPQPESGGVGQDAAPPDEGGETIHVRLIDASQEVFGAEYVLASLNDATLTCAAGCIETQIRRAGNGAAMEDILETAIDFGDEKRKFQLRDIGPEA